MRTQDLLTSLIAFPSVSASSNVAVTDFVDSTLTELGFQTERLAYFDSNSVEKSCVIGQIGPKQGRGLAWFGHTDVVPATSWSRQHEPWDATQENGRIYGRGSCDMKGPIACMLTAAAATDLDRLTEPLTIVCTADEEIGMVGAQKVASDSHLFRQCVDLGSRGIIGEPTRLQVVHAHKGGLAYRIVAKGFAAHSSTPEGICANYQMIPFLQAMYELHQEFESKSQWHDRRFDPATVTMNLLINDGVSAMNITPGHSECKIYIRPTPGIDWVAAADRIESAAEKFDLQIERIAEYPPMYTEPDSDFVQQLLVQQNQRTSQTVAYGTDGAFFTELKELVILGPGDIRQAHTDDEWISLEQLDLGTQLYTNLINEYCC